MSAISPILGIPQVVPSQSNKEVTINNAIAMLEAAENGAVGITFTGASLTLTVAQFAGSQLFVTSGNGAGATLIVPSVMNAFPTTRQFAVQNNGSAPLIVKSDATGTNATSEVPVGEIALIYADSANVLLLTTSAQADSGISFSNSAGSVASGVTTVIVSNNLNVTSSAEGVVTLDISSSLASGGLAYEGVWNASTNTPALASGQGTKGYFYTVSVAGTTSLDGYAAWNVGDKALYNGTTWEKIDGVASEASLDSTGRLPWAQLPAEVQNLPLGFVIPGAPPAGAIFNLPMAMAVTIPANFAGTVGYAGTAATANAAFTVNHIASGGGVTAIGTITFGTGGGTAITLSQQGAVNLAAGDVLQIVAPATADTTLANCGLTILAAKV